MGANELRARGTLLSKYLARAGSINMNAAGTVGTPLDFDIAPVAGTILLIDTLVITLVAGAAFTATGFGSLATLTNGIQVFCNGGTGEVDVDRTAQRVIKQTTHLSALADMYSVVSLGANTQHISRHCFPTPIVVGPGGYYRWRIRDTLTGLADLTVYAKGCVVPV